MAVEIRRATLADIPELSRLVAALAAWEESLDSRARFDWDGIRDAPNWLKLVLNRSIMRFGSRPQTGGWSGICGFGSSGRPMGRSRNRSAISARLLWRRASEDAG